MLSLVLVGAYCQLFLSKQVSRLVGAMLSELITNWTIYSNKLAALLTLVIITAINLAVGFLPHVDNFAHIGGFISGFCLGFVFLIRPQFRWVSQKNAPLGYHTGPVNKHKAYQYILWLIAAIFLIAGYAVGIIMLFRGFSAKDHCSWCHYMSCIPTSLWNCNKSTNNLYCSITETGNQYNLTCEGNGRSRMYSLPNASSDQIQAMCTQLCT